MASRRNKKDWSIQARRALQKEAIDLNTRDRATPKHRLDKCQLHEEAEQAMREFKSRQPDSRKNLDDFLHKKY